jgi:hypothetical protein
MKIQRCYAIWGSALLLSLILLAGTAAQAQGKTGKYACAEPNPASLCNAGNACGSASTPCTVDVKKAAGNGASATPSIAGAKGNAFFCVTTSTTVTWQSSSKNTGFVIDFGPASPFDAPDAIIGGAKKPVSVVAQKEGCFKYSVGACVSGAIYGMCGSGRAEAVVIGGGAK